MNKYEGIMFMLTEMLVKEGISKELNGTYT